MKLPGRRTQRFAVALLMATLLGPVGGGLAGHQMGLDVGGVTHRLDMGNGRAGHHTAMATEATAHHAPAGEQVADHQMGGNDCAENDSGESHRCAGLWSTACCDYFAPGAKIKVEPSLESRFHASPALPVGAVAEVLEPAALWAHLILPTSGEGRAGPISLVILHSSLRL